MAAYGNALQSSEELLTKAKGTKPRRDVPPVERVAKGSFTALIRDYKRAKFPELGQETQDFYTRPFARLERAGVPLTSRHPADWNGALFGAPVSGRY